MATDQPSPLAVPTTGASAGTAASPSSAASPAYRKPEDSFRDEIARVIFGDIGAIRDDYSCAVESKILLHGRMYITDKFICFYSNFFGFEKKIKIPFSHVLKITKGNTALLIPNSIIIVTSRKEYCFRSFWDRDECYYQMAAAYRAHRRLPPATRDAIFDSRSIDKDGNMEASVAAAPTSSPFSSSSGVQPSASPSSGAAAAAAVAATADASQLPPVVPVSLSSSSSGGATTPPRSTSPRLDERAAAAAAAAAAGAAAAATTTTTTMLGINASSRASLDASGIQQARAGEDGGDQGSVSSYDEDDMLDFDDLREGARNQVSADLGAAFEKAAREEPPLKEKGLEFRLRRPVTVQDFFEEFVSDRAPLGVDKYHEANGDRELEISPWQEVNQGVGATRSVRFVAPLDGLPVGPPTAPVLQLQRVRVFGQHGMILETSTTMENVPAADCFTLEDRWLIAPTNPDAPEEGGLAVRTSFEVRFVKSTFFRKIIEGRSRNDTLHYHKTYFEMVEKHMARKHRAAERAHSRQSASAASSSASGVAAAAARPPTPRVDKEPTGEAGSGVGEVLAVLHTVAGRIKWDRFVVAVLVFTCAFSLLRLLLGALFPTAPGTITRGGGGGTGAPSAAQWEALLQELKALRTEVQGLRSEMRLLHDRLAK